jgi:hypothetical protein
MRRCRDPSAVGPSFKDELQLVDLARFGTSWPQKAHYPRQDSNCPRIPLIIPQIPPEAAQNQAHRPRNRVDLAPTWLQSSTLGPRCPKRSAPASWRWSGRRADSRFSGVPTLSTPTEPPQTLAKVLFRGRRPRQRAFMVPSRQSFARDQTVDASCAEHCLFFGCVV